MPRPTVAEKLTCEGEPNRVALANHSGHAAEYTTFQECPKWPLLRLSLTSTGSPSAIIKSEVVMVGRHQPGIYPSASA